MAVARTATVTGNRNAASSASLAVTATCNTATTGTDHQAVVLVNISVSTNSADTTCAVTYGGVAMTQQQLTLVGSSTSRAGIGLYTLANPLTGSQNVIATSGGASTKVAIAAGGGVYSGVGSLSAVTAAATTGLTVPSVTNGYIVVGTTNGAALSAPNRNSLYLAGTSVSGVGDYISVQDVAGAASVAFTNTGTATTPQSLGISLAPPNPKMSTFTDDFTAGVGNWSNTGGVTAESGAARITHAAGPAYESMTRNAFYDLSDDEVLLQVKDFGNQSFALHKVALNIIAETGNNKFQLVAFGNSFRAYKFVAGSPTQIGSSLTLNTSTHAWWRLQETAGTVFIDTAPDGLAWTNRWSDTTPFSVTSMQPQIECATDGSEGISSGLFDNFNAAPAAAPAPRTYQYSTAVHRASLY